MATHYGLHVRRIMRGTGFDAELVVQQRNPVTLEWSDYATFSEMLDSAYTDSHRCAWTLSAGIGPSGMGGMFPVKTMAA